MFYLNNIFHLLKHFPIRLLALTAFTIVLVLGSSQKERVEKVIGSEFEKKENHSYFYTLISAKENYDRLARKLKVLPGVHKVKIMKKESVTKQIKDILGRIDVDAPMGIVDLDYAGLKVIFEKNLHSRSQNLIRDYINRLIKPENLTLGNIKNPSKEKSRKESLNWLTKWGFWSFFGMLAVLWSFLFFSILSPLLRESYLVEQYQRRTNVAFKTIALTLMIFILGGWAMSFSLGNVNYLIGGVTSVFCLLISGLSLIRYSWVNS